jgi:hypothetical protein
MAAAQRAKEEDDKKRKEKAVAAAEQAAFDEVDLSEIDKKAEEEVEKAGRRMKQGQLRS